MMHEPELDIMTVLQKVRALPEDHYNLVLQAIEDQPEGVKLSAQEIMDLVNTPVEELAKSLDHQPLMERMLRMIVRETYEATCMECGYEENVEEEALEEYLAEAKKNWIAKAIKHPGALHKTAEKKGLAKKGEPLSQTDLDKLEAMGGKTAKRARLARTLKGLKK